MDTHELAYMAGVIDSDGCIGVYKSTYGMRTGHMRVPNYSAKVQIRQVEEAAIRLAHSIFRGHVYLHGPQCERGRPLWVWQVHSAACVPVLVALLPYLRIKRNRAENALLSCELNAQAGRRRFEVPPVKADEPMVSLSEAATRLGKSYAVVHQAVMAGTVPFVRGPRNGRRPSVFVPASFLSTWATRGSSPTRNPEVSAALEACYQRSKVLNRVGV